MRHFFKPAFVRETAFLLLMVAMLVRAFMPAGLMPVFGDAGSVQMVICSGISEKTLTVDGAGEDGRPIALQAFDICGFSVNIGGVAPAAQPLLPVPDVFKTASEVMPAAPVRTDIVVQPNPSRGPPSA